MSPSPSRSPLATWPLLGREPELERIAAARDDPQTRGIVLSGSAGVGKSRLAREALEAAEAGGALVAWVAATRSAAAVPFGAFAALIPDDARSDEPLELMRRSVEALRERAAGRRVVLGVDDAQLLDPVSAALVLHLTLTETAFVLATVRTGEPCPDAIVSLWKDGLARRLDLDRLSAASTSALVEAAVGGPVEQAALQWVCESSEGNALYVRELVLGALDAGQLQESGGLWRLARRPDVSRPLAELVAERMAGLADDERRTLELLALGEPMRTDELVALTGSEPLMAAEAHGLAVVVAGSGGGEVRLAHPLYGEVMRQGLPALRARDLRRRLAATVRERVPLVPGDALRVARWLLDAGEPISVALLIDAARAANLAGDPELGALLAEQAIADGAGVEATLLLARSFAVRKRFGEAEDVLARTEGAIDDQETALNYLEQRAVTVLYWGLRRPQEALALIERAQAWWPEQAWQRRLDPLRLHLASLINGFEGAIAVGEDILADPDLDAETRRQLEPVHALNLFYVGRMRDAHALGRRNLPSVPLRDTADGIALTAWGILGMESGLEWPALFEYMTEMLQAGVRANDHEAAGTAALTLGGLTWFQGRFAESRRWLAEAELHFEQQDTFGKILGARATMVGVALFTGDDDGVETAIARCRALPAWDAPLPSLRPYVARTEAWATYAAGDRRQAPAMLLDAAAELPEMPAYAAPLAYEALRLGGAPARVAPVLSALAGRCDGPMPAACALHAEALAAEDGAALLAAADAMERYGGLRYGMEAAAAAVPVFLQQGRQDSARRAAARARELYQDGQGAPPLHFDGLDAAAVALTARETQLVELASRGLSNAEIADRLVLSVRTVESHIYRAMQKLGVSDRRDL